MILLPEKPEPVPTFDETLEMLRRSDSVQPAATKLAEPTTPTDKEK